MLNFQWKQKCVSKEDSACNRDNPEYLSGCIKTWKVHDQTSICDKVGVRMCWFIIFVLVLQFYSGKPFGWLLVSRREIWELIQGKKVQRRITNLYITQGEVLYRYWNLELGNYLDGFSLAKGKGCKDRETRSFSLMSIYSRKRHTPLPTEKLGSIKTNLMGESAHLWVKSDPCIWQLGLTPKSSESSAWAVFCSVRHWLKKLSFNIGMIHGWSLL